MKNLTETDKQTMKASAEMSAFNNSLLAIQSKANDYLDCGMTLKNVKNRAKFVSNKLNDLMSTKLDCGPGKHWDDFLQQCVPD